MNIIFLDFDGVLNTQFHQDLLLSRKEKLCDSFGPIFDPDAVRNLELVLKETGAQIVIESTWKDMGLEWIQRMWSERHLPGEVIDITPMEINIDVLREVKEQYPDNENFWIKGAEIKSWIKQRYRHNPDNTDELRYVIFDDEYVVLDEQLPHFILTNPIEGISDVNADRAIQLLNG